MVRELTQHHRLFLRKLDALTFAVQDALGRLDARMSGLEQQLGKARGSAKYKEVVVRLCSSSDPGTWARGYALAVLGGDPRLVHQCMAITGPTALDALPRKLRAALLEYVLEALQPAAAADRDWSALQQTTRDVALDWISRALDDEATHGRYRLGHVFWSRAESALAELGAHWDPWRTRIQQYTRTQLRAALLDEEEEEEVVEEEEEEKEEAGRGSRTATGLKDGDVEEARGGEEPAVPSERNGKRGSKR